MVIVTEMKMPLFFAIPSIAKALDPTGSIPLGDVLVMAGAPVKASGAWVNRPIKLTDQEGIRKLPGDWSLVEIGVPPKTKKIKYKL